MFGRKFDQGRSASSLLPLKRLRHTPVKLPCALTMFVAPKQTADILPHVPCLCPLLLAPAPLLSPLHAKGARRHYGALLVNQERTTEAISQVLVVSER